MLLQLPLLRLAKRSAARLQVRSQNLKISTILPGRRHALSPHHRHARLHHRRDQPRRAPWHRLPQRHRAGAAGAGQVGLFDKTGTVTLGRPQVARVSLRLP